MFMGDLLLLGAGTYASVHEGHTLGDSEYEDVGYGWNEYYKEDETYEYEFQAII